jgi:1-deoxy-D-xylulose-5-phosphate reductoisomerase
MNFEPPDMKTFRNLALAIGAMHKGGNMPCILNAANELAVYGFLKNRIGFLDMTEIIERTMSEVTFIEKPTLEEYFDSDGAAREYAATLIDL